MDLEKILELEEENLILHRRNLHRIPELGLNLPKTTEYIVKELEKSGIEYICYEDISAVVAIIDGGFERTLAIRADMDGLPICEQTDLLFASENQNMHACGHDGHAAIALICAKILNENKKNLKSNIKIFFQPGEEYPGGAEPMIKKGVLENPKVDAIVGLHLGEIDKSIPKGNIGINRSIMMASMDRFFIKLSGRGGHGAYPHESSDVITAGTILINALNDIISREISATNTAVLSVTRISAGTNQNILPEVCEIEGTVRATDDSTREFIKRRICEISEAIAAAKNVRSYVEYDFKYPATVNDGDFTDRFLKSARKIVDEERITFLKNPVMGGEDMSFFLREVPGCYFFLSSLKEGAGAHHSPKFDIDESFLKLGAKLLLQTAFDFD